MFLSILRSISKKEWIFLIAASLFFIITANYVYMVGYWSTPDQRAFLGIHSQTPSDFFVYYSYINQVKNGNYIFYDVFTGASPQTGFFNWFWLAVGLLGKVFNLSAVVTFHAARILLIPPLIIFLYISVSFFFKALLQRAFAFLLSFASGLGFFWTFFSREGEYAQN